MQYFIENRLGRFGPYTWEKACVEWQACKAPCPVGQWPITSYLLDETGDIVDITFTPVG
jgi:hypothetical protein